jgi:hypothetical protein
MVIISRKPKWNGENGESVTMTQLLRNHVERTTFCVINIVYRYFSCIDAFDSIMKVRWLYWTCTPSYAEVQAQKRMTGPYQHTQKSILYWGLCS